MTPGTKLAIAAGVPLELSALLEDDPSDAVDALAAFVDHLETLQLGTPECTNGLTAVDTDADTLDDAYVDVPTRTPVCWKLLAKTNAGVAASAAPQSFRATARVLGDGVTQLDARDVYFIVPPLPLD
jgi:hypothetical protein